MTKKDWLNSKKIKVISILASFGIFLPGVVFADPVGELIGEIMFKIALSPLVLALQIEMWILPIIAKYNGFTTDAGVVAGWAVLRDLSNMFFILILLVIAFATILGIQSYGYKQLLSRLIIVAILINFSRTIVGIFIDFSQIIMLTFLQAIQGVLHGGIFVALGLRKIIDLADNQPTDIGAIVVALIFGAIMLGITIIVIGIVIVLLIMRIIKIWIAVVMSPLAFLAYVLPKTQSYASKWASTLGKELTAGPMLLFFLWLALIIVGQGDVNKQFLKDPVDSEAAIEEVSAALTPENLLNYAIGIALLVGGLQVTAASGAAGAALAGKAAGGIQSFAARKARGLASRTAAGLGSTVVDREGNMRGGALGTFVRRIPGWGGLLQRTAIKAKGYDAQRQAKEREEALKDIPQEMRGAYVGSMSPSRYEPKDWKQDKDGQYYKVNEDREYIDKDGNRIEDQADVSQRVTQNAWQKMWPAVYSAGRAVKRVASLGESGDHEVTEALIKHERGEITAENAEWATTALRRSGTHQDTVDKINKNFVKYTSEAEVNRAIEKYGLDHVMGDIRGEALMDPKTGKPTKSANIWAKAILKHAKSDPNAMMKLALKNDKFDRWTMAEVFRDVDVNEYYDMSKHKRYETDEEGNAVVDKKGILTESYDNAANVRDLFIEKLYPNMLADRKEGKDFVTGLDRRHTATIDPERIKFKPGTVADTVQQRSFESLEQYKQRSSEISGLDLVELDEETGEIKEDTITTDSIAEAKAAGLFEGKTKEEREKKFEAWRQQKYRENKFLTRATKNDLSPITEEDFKDKEKGEYYRNQVMHDNSELSNLDYAIKYNSPEGDRHDLSSMGNTPAKESEEIRAARYAKYANPEADPEYFARINEIKRKLDDIDALKKPDNVSDSVWDRMQARRKAEVVGDDRAVHGLVSDTFYVEGQDGGDGSRAAEINLSDEHESRIFQHVMHAFEKGQQGSFLNVATSRQLVEGLEALTKFGKLPTKLLTENSPRPKAAEALQTLTDVGTIKDGGVTSNMKLMGPAYWDWQGTAKLFATAAAVGLKEAGKDVGGIVKNALDSRDKDILKHNKEGRGAKNSQGSAPTKQDNKPPKKGPSMEGLQDFAASEKKKEDDKKAS